MMKERLLQYLQDHQSEQFSLLEDIVLQGSHSRFKKGVDAVGSHLIKSLTNTGLSLEVHEEESLGNQLIFKTPTASKTDSSVLLTGHMDTVFPEDSTFNYYRDDGEKVYGPGVIDMKGGLVAAVYALKALSACGLLEKIPVTLICNSDEEIGSPASSPLIKKEAADSLFGLVFECGGLSGELVTGRKGKAGFILEIEGQAGHAAFAGVDKASAIHELAYDIIELEKLNDDKRKIVVNVGTIKGGIGPNSVAESAYAEIDTRFMTVEDAEDTVIRIEEIVQSIKVTGTKAKLYKSPSRLPMMQTEKNRELFQLIRQQADTLGLQCVEELRSGVSDSNTIAQVGIPVVDGLGPIGDCDHSDREYMIKASLPQRTRLAALSILEGWRHYSN